MRNKKSKAEERKAKSPVEEAKRKSWFRKAMVGVVLAPIVVIGAVLKAKHSKA